MIDPAIIDAIAYEPEAGIFRWRVSPAVSVPRGAKAGCKKKSGYVVIAFKGKHYLAHRVAWMIMTGREPANQVDHKNRIRSDNRWSNLREATQTQNNGNTCSERPLPKGVTIHKGTGKFQAQIRCGKNHYLGLFDNVGSAHAAYAAAAAKYFGEFARTVA